MPATAAVAALEIAIGTMCGCGDAACGVGERYKQEACNRTADEAAAEW